MPVAGKPNLSVTLTSDTKQLTEFVVIGSRNTHRTKTDTPVPVDVISVKDIASNLPQPDLAQMLKNIAPSFNSLRTAGGDMDSHVDAAQLRNQPPNQTLVLLNTVCPWAPTGGILISLPN
jgi:iron complex outermembrane receptor protein